MASIADQMATIVKSCRSIMRKDKGLSGELDRLPMLTWLLLLKFLDDYDLVREAEADLASSRFVPTIHAPYRWRDWAAIGSPLTGDDLLRFVNLDEVETTAGARGPGLLSYLRALSGENERDRRDVVSTVFAGVDNRMRNGYLLRDVLNKVDSLHLNKSVELESLGHVYESMLRELRDAAGDSGEFYTPRPVVRFMVEATNLRLGDVVLDPACGTGGFLVEAYSNLKTQAKTAEDFVTLQSSIQGGEAKSLPYLLAQMNLVLHGVEDPNIDPGNSLRHKLSEIGERDRVDVILTNPPFGGEEERGVLDNFPPDRRTSETSALFMQLILRKLRRPKQGRGGGRAAVVVSDGFLSTRGVLGRVKEDLLDQANLHTIVRLPKGVFAPYTPIKTNILFFEYGAPTEDVWFYELSKPQGRQMYTKTKPLPYEDLNEVLENWWSDRHETSTSWKVSATELAARGFDLDVVNPHRPVDAETQSPAEIIDLAHRGASTLVDEVSTLSHRLRELPKPELLALKPLSAAISQRKKYITIDDDTEYKLVTVSLHGRGLKPRGSKLGSEIKTKKQYMLQANDLVVAEIDAKMGGWGLVPASLAGSIVSGHYFVYDIDDAAINRRFLDWYLRSELPETDIQQFVKGSTNYASIRGSHFPLLEIHFPSRKWQDDFVERMDVLAEAALAAERKVDALQVEIQSILPSVLMRTFQPNLNAEEAQV